MTRWMFIAAFALAGCPTANPDQQDTDDTVAVDTEPNRDTGWGNSDDEDTDTDTDVEHTGAKDSGGGGGGSDTGPACHFGEVEDCNGVCYPEYFVGDGYCDDGNPLPADFNCPLFTYDQGDCQTDTDPPIGDACSYLIRLHLFNYVGESGWRLEDSTGKVLARVNSGTYTENNRIYDYPIDLSNGQYTFIGTDSNGDTWDGGGWWELVENRTGRQVASGRNMGLGREYAWPAFMTQCSTDVGCDIDVRTLAGEDGPEMGWEVYTAASGLQWGQRVVTTIPANTVTDDLIHVYDGAYVFRLRDAGANGWKGRAEIRYTGGALLDAYGLGTGSNTAGTFTVTCANSGLPAIDAPGAALTPSDCSKVSLQMTTTANGIQDGFAVYRVSNWGLIAVRNPGSFGDNQTYFVNVALPASGLYYLRLLDSRADGWEGGSLAVRDGINNALLMQLGLPSGAGAGKYMDVTCPAVTNPGDTDEDSASNPGTCAPGAVRDCDNVCWPSNYVGDSTCNDGTIFAANFACEAFGFDGGDCVAP